MIERRTKEDKPVLAICYDFDKTLSPDDMQAQGYIQEVYDSGVKAFWDECRELAEANEMDSNLAYMRKMVEYAHGRIVLTRKTLREYGSKVGLFPGVEEWFKRIKDFGKQHDVIVEHYIISSNMKDYDNLLAASRLFINGDKEGAALKLAKINTDGYLISRKRQSVFDLLFPLLVVRNNYCNGFTICTN